MIKLFKKRWMLFDQVVKPYKPYVTVDYGVIPVSVDDIFADIAPAPTKKAPAKKPVANIFDD